MASLKCSKCGYGIHYHDEPNGTELHLFEKNEWLRLIKDTLPLSLYRLEGTKEHYYIWKCFECGSLHLFVKNSGVQIYGVYETVNDMPNTVEISRLTNGILFDDVTWDYITEFDMDWEDTKRKCEEINYKIKCKYVRFNDEYILVYSDEDFKNLDSVYKRLEEELE